MISLDAFAITVLAGIIFLLISSFSLRPSDKIGVPHSVLLVIIGILLSLTIKFVPELSFLEKFQISPELIFFVFLPTLLFESAFTTPLRKILSDWIPIGILAIIGYLISTGFIAGATYGILTLIGINIPFFAILLFAIIISATDPVAVLSVFKKLGVTPRLTRLFEGESLFNDGTSWAAFSIFLSFLVFHGGDIAKFSPMIAFLQFVVMVIGGILFGVAMGHLFSWLVERVKGEEVVQMTLTLIMAHSTFLLADLSKHLLHFGEHEFEISAIIATVTASLILGSRGIQKFAPEVRNHMHALWEHFSFIVNSLIFILIGMLSVKVLNIENIKSFGLPIAISIVVVIIARIVSIYIPLGAYNIFATEKKKIPKDWMKILSWGSLRGAIAVACLLVIPDDLSIAGWSHQASEKEFIMTMVISCILFTTLVKAMSLEYFVDKMHLAKFSKIEEIESLEGKILAVIKVLERIHALQEKKYISKKNAKKLTNKYEKVKRSSIKKLAKIFNSKTNEIDIDQIISLHGLTVEKKVTQVLLDNKEITEKTFWVLQDKILRQEDRIKMDKNQTQGENISLDEIEHGDIPLRYQMSRARIIIISKVLKRLNELCCPELCIPSEPLSRVIKRYTKWKERAEEIRHFIEEKHQDISQKIEYDIFVHYSTEIEQEEVTKLNKRSMMDNRVYEQLKKEL